MSDNLVTLGIYTTGIQAQMDKNLLESKGIAASVTEEAPLFPTAHRQSPPLRQQLRDPHKPKGPDPKHESWRS